MVTYFNRDNLLHDIDCTCLLTPGYAIITECRR